MIGWARAKRHGWRKRSGHEQVEMSSLWVLYVVPWVYLLSGLPPLFPEFQDSSSATTLAWGVLALGLAQCLVVPFALRTGVDCYLGQAGPPWGWLGGLAGAAAVQTGLLVAAVAVTGLEVPSKVGMGMFAALTPALMVLSLTMPVRRTFGVVGAWVVLVAAALLLVGMDPVMVCGSAFVLVAGSVLDVFSPRCTAWYIAVMRKLAEARETQGRLAVAEERLRFGRDLHDVMGRNLSVIALKSELAVQLARRGSEAMEQSIEQMTEVQRLARESQTEVREVVRGYREAGLDTELAGARGVLRAAGVDCVIERSDHELPAPVQSALGWVVREGATNVLRHADATRCTVRVRAADGSAVLLVENDGAGNAPKASGGGSGLPGLRERLAVLGGTLTAENDGRGGFRLCAQVPLGAGTDGDGEVRDGETEAGGRERRSSQGPAGEHGQHGQHGEWTAPAHSRPAG